VALGVFFLVRLQLIDFRWTVANGCV
jgi:hypothetical protein